MFDNISQASKAIYELIKKKNTEIKKELNGYDLIVENEMLSEKINFNLSKLEQDINWKVEKRLRKRTHLSLCRRKGRCDNRQRTLRYRLRRQKSSRNGARGVPLVKNGRKSGAAAEKRFDRGVRNSV